MRLRRRRAGAASGRDLGPFYQGTGRERDREQGLGLGLSIVRAACEALGRDIDSGSIEGTGSWFAIGLPVSKAAPTEAPAGDDELARDCVASAYVLHPEDDSDARASQEALMTTWGIRFVSGAMASEVLARMASPEREPDAIVTDFRLSEAQTGADAIAAIRAHYDRCIPAIAVTGDLARPGDALYDLPKDDRRRRRHSTAAVRRRRQIHAALERQFHGLMNDGRVLRLLGDEPEDPSRQRPHHRFPVVLVGQHDDRRAHAVSFQASQIGETGFVVEADIQEDEVEPIVLERMRGLVATGGRSRIPQG